MRPLTLLSLFGAAALLGFTYATYPERQEPGRSTEVIANPKQDDRERLFLSAEQRREATAAGGFVVAPVSLLRVDAPMRYGDFKWNEDHVPSGPVTIRVDLRTQVMSVFRAGHEIGTAVVLYGADGKETPLGRFPILWKGRDHRSSIYDAPMPYTLRLTGDGVAIHGSDVRRGAATNGCIGIPKEFAREVFAEAHIGDAVTIVRTTSKRRAS